MKVKVHGKSITVKNQGELDKARELADADEEKVEYIPRAGNRGAVWRWKKTKGSAKEGVAAMFGKAAMEEGGGSEEEGESEGEDGEEERDSEEE